VYTTLGKIQRELASMCVSATVDRERVFAFFSASVCTCARVRMCVCACVRVCACARVRVCGLVSVC